MSSDSPGTGSLLWGFEIDDDRFLSHHDLEPLPNGNVLVTVWDKKTAQEAIAAGRNPELIKEGEGVWSESIWEVQPDGLTGGKIVWQWNAWDHLIQDFDPEKPNYGDPAQHPELINLNFTGRTGGPGGDWIHLNAIDYNPDLDQILLSTPAFHEVWIIDHSTDDRRGGRPRRRQTGRRRRSSLSMGQPENLDGRVGSVAAPVLSA